MSGLSSYISAHLALRMAHRARRMAHGRSAESFNDSASLKAPSTYGAATRTACLEGRFLDEAGSSLQSKESVACFREYVISDMQTCSGERDLATALVAHQK
jgi:hypothetical protein